MNTLYFDGASKSNPGKSSCGWYLEIDQEIIEGYKYIGDNITNNQAEYHGLINGLKTAIVLDVKIIEVYGDSNLVIQQMKGKFKVKSLLLMPLWLESKELQKNFDKISFHWIQRSENFKADALANKAFKI